MEPESSSYREGGRGRKTSEKALLLTTPLFSDHHRKKTTFALVSRNCFSCIVWYTRGCRKGILHDTASCSPCITFSDLLRYVLHDFLTISFSFFVWGFYFLFAEVRFAQMSEVSFALIFRSLIDNAVCMLYCHFLVCGLVCGDFFITDVTKIISLCL